MSRATYILEKVIVAHIEAPPGAGKTTLMYNLKNEFPEFVFADLDWFRNQAADSMEDEGIYYKDDWQEFRRRVKKEFESWRRKQKKPIVLFGFGELDYDWFLRIETPDGKILMNVPSTEIAKRFLKREGKQEYSSEIKRSKFELITNKLLRYLLLVHSSHFDKKRIKDKGYKPMKPKSISKKLKQISGRFKNE